MAVEYKGSHLTDSQDTKEKANIGAIWEKASKGKGLFLLAVKSQNGKTVAEQIRKKIG
jgi:type III restriction enzyme